MVLLPLSKQTNAQEIMRARFTHILSCTLFTLAILIPAVASADLYKYQTADGEIMISTQPRSDLKLVEVISTGGGSSSPARSSSGSKKSVKRSEKAQKNIDKAQTAKLKHIARHGKRNSTEGMSFSEREIAFDDIIEEASATYNVPFAFIKGVIRVESSFNPFAVSRAGAQGLMQLMPRTAKGLNVTDPFDPRQNIFGGTKLLRLLIDQYDGDINLVLSAYNAGGVAVKRYDGIPYPQTRDYVASVYRWYKHYSAVENQEL
mgnify:CR=1 FL=1